MRSSILLLLVAGISLSQGPVEMVNPEVRRVGDKLACKCGTCNNTVGNCPMLHCHYTEPARQRISEMLKQGASDEAIVAAFVKEQGLSALSSPPGEGFSLLSWTMPFVAIAAGLGVIWLYIRRFRKPATDPAPAATDSYRQRIEKELSELD